MPVTGLLRHGEVAGGTRFRGRSDDPLTPEGWRRMAAALADKRLRVTGLEGVHGLDGRVPSLQGGTGSVPEDQSPVAIHSWERIVTSPLRRCAAFARDWGERHGIAVSTDERLAELDFGDWEGRTPAEIHATDPQALGRFWTDPWRHPPPGGESLEDFRRRVLAAWHDWNRRQGNILFITHGGVIRLLLWHRRRWPPQRIMEIQVGHGELVLLEAD